MSETTSTRGAGVGSLAERQMRRWALGLEIQDRLEHEKALKELPHQTHAFIAISREHGAGGGMVARQASQLLGWEVLDRELLDYMAQRYRIDRNMLDFIDEAKSNWLLELFGKWINRKLVTPSEYISHLGQIVLLSARSGSCVFVGRGVQYLLPRDRGLFVRIVAPWETRVKEVMQRNGCPREEAERLIRETDATRRDYIQTEFQRDVEDLHEYDLGLNREYLDASAAADLVVQETRRRFDVPQS